ncbi:MAG: ParA family protein, partial [Tepidisphaeraceae bacterium]
MRTFAIINQKGGCGKTTTSINLAACLARTGYKTLLADMDPQGHCGVGLAVPEEQIERTIYNCLMEPSDGKVARIPDVVWQIASDFDLAPSNIQLAAFEQVFSGRPGREDRLRTALEVVASSYKCCIIDCPPSVGLLTFNALRACDEVLVPVETGFFSLHGLAKMMETLDVMRQKCGREIPGRVLPTQYDTRTKLAREVLSELRSKFRDRLMTCTINFNTKLKEAASFGQPITEYDPASRGYKDFVTLARELMGACPAEAESTSPDRLSRPAELVQRAKQLAQLTNVQFGRTEVTQPVADRDGGVAVAEPDTDTEVQTLPASPALAAAAEAVQEAREEATQQKIRAF